MIESGILPLFTPAAEKHAYWWNVAGEWVEAPNVRRHGWSGVLRVRHDVGIVYVKRQYNHLCRTLAHPFGWPTASREHLHLHVLRQLELNVPVPLFHAVMRRAGAVEAVLVTAALEGFAPLNALPRLDHIERTAVAREVGHVVGRMHRARIQHSCLYDKHVMVRWHGAAPEVALLDLEKARARLTPGAAARHDLDQLRRHQDLWSAPEWELLLASHARAMAGAGAARGDAQREAGRPRSFEVRPQAGV
ncbi:lipopolysaccharide kinase InaA family protein [Aromatoleum sp.]|uniref:lipopolysaccharide kinase InaA family protein n=1 Tax=Aromatoleum sp. TaxID=2307007 RepID=UPI002FC5C22A